MHLYIPCKILRPGGHQQRQAEGKDRRERLRWKGVFKTGLGRAAGFWGVRMLALRRNLHSLIHPLMHSHTHALFPPALWCLLNDRCHPSSPQPPIVCWQPLDKTVQQHFYCFCLETPPFLSFLVPGFVRSCHRFGCDSGGNNSAFAILFHTRSSQSAAPYPSHSESPVIPP